MDGGPGPFAGDISPSARLAGPGEGISPEELALAARNHGLPLEALRYDLTPPGLHYVLVHYDIPYVPGTSVARSHGWQLTVHGRVRRPLALDVAALRSFPAVTLRVTMECAGNGRALLAPRPVSQPWLVEAVGTAEWTGVPLRLLLAEAGVEPDAVEAVFGGADHGVERGVEQDYRRSLPLDVATGDDPEVLVAYRMNGGPLPPQHGHPLRLVVPGWYGMAHVKWLREIRLTGTPFTGFQQAMAYRYRQEPGDPGQPVTRMAPRALMIPPGYPDFMSRIRFVRPGRVLLEGRAWSGWPPVTRVEVTTDDCRSWYDAELTPPDRSGAHLWAWQRWQSFWTATPGDHVLAARATDAAGRVQPLTQPWNRGGFGNNRIQRIPVHCGPGRLG
ncbi:sulfite oxidase [Streptomyces sp. NPDC002917]|uniref:sulfite oxidase n=1 Tax=unclassified Streptomyces TaxID=2593676 RepID=UPI002E809DA8|nr:sulfite oxidase [Streptomyces sp. NBC_00562]WTC81021.1 sulfite oxidase [Streptomyces sp. NBC_01653]WTD34404.1 sulfite oxidase [Streptomyces sp. NBC_01643]WTD89845.1 sulfite oxidase [Streptomyces sp. NBC_01637]WUC20861.1 sulfite oxidase [Streptomyces sp. NBC_00562]